MTERLLRIGLLNAQRAAVGRPLREHKRDFVAALRAKGVSEKHAVLLDSRLERIFEGCEFRRWSEISAGKFAGWLERLRTDVTDNGETTRGISAHTSNFYVQALKQFCRWAVRERCIHESPVAHLTSLNVRLDRRHDRRALSGDELSILVHATWDGPLRLGMTGPERSMLYRLAAETGLRVGELRSLTPASFRFGKSPTVTVAAGYSKRRREDVLPLRTETAKALESFCVAPEPDQAVFRLPEKPAAMLREDLEAARAKWLEACKDPVTREAREKSAFLKYADENGHVADFHALRHTFHEPRPRWSASEARPGPRPPLRHQPDSVALLTHEA